MFAAQRTAVPQGLCLHGPAQRQVDSVRYQAPSVCTVISEVRAEPLGEPGSSFHVRDHSDGLYYILNLHIRNNYVLSLLIHPSAVMDGLTFSTAVRKISGIC